MRARSGTWGGERERDAELVGLDVELEVARERVERDAVGDELLEVGAGEEVVGDVVRAHRGGEEVRRRVAAPRGARDHEEHGAVAEAEVVEGGASGGGHDSRAVRDGGR